MNFRLAFWAQRIWQIRGACPRQIGFVVQKKTKKRRHRENDNNQQTRRIVTCETTTGNFCICFGPCECAIISNGCLGFSVVFHLLSERNKRRCGMIFARKKNLHLHSACLLFIAYESFDWRLITPRRPMAWQEARVCTKQASCTKRRSIRRGEREKCKYRNEQHVFFDHQFTYGRVRYCYRSPDSLLFLTATRMDGFCFRYIKNE